MSTEHTKLNNSNRSQQEAAQSTTTKIKGLKIDPRYLEKLRTGTWPTRKPRIIWTDFKIDRVADDNQKSVTSESMSAARMSLREHHTRVSTPQDTFRDKRCVPIRQPRGTHTQHRDLEG